MPYIIMKGRNPITLKIGDGLREKDEKNINFSSSSSMKKEEGISTLCNAQNRNG